MFICIFNRIIHFECGRSEAIIRKVAALSRQFMETWGHVQPHAGMIPVSITFIG